MTTKDARLEVLHDHYVDSFTHLQGHRRHRDWLFVLLVATLVVMMFQVSAPTRSGAAISQAISTQLGLDFTIDISFLSSVIWLVLLGLLLRYSQIVVTMERQYVYMHALEELLSAEYQGAAFTREGKAYLVDYPLLLNWASLFYTVFFPVLVLAVASARILQELTPFRGLDALLIFDAAAYLATVVSTVLYLISIHCHKVEKDSEKNAAT